MGLTHWLGETSILSMRFCEAEPRIHAKLIHTSGLEAVCSARSL